MIGDIRGQTDTAELFDGDLARLVTGLAPRTLQQAKAHILPDRKAVKKRPALKQHPHLVELRLAHAPTGMGHVLPIHRDLSRIRANDPKHAFQCDRLAGARPANDDSRAATRDRQIHTAKDFLGAKGLGDTGQRNHVPNKASVRM